jgi:hypothetical protein
VSCLEVVSNLACDFLVLGQIDFQLHMVRSFVVS